MRRPDLLEKADLSDEDKKLLQEVIEQNASNAEFGVRNSE
jgi:hypothetical protein